jgi:hypothetical protein
MSRDALTLVWPVRDDRREQLIRQAVIETVRLMFPLTCQNGRMKAKLGEYLDWGADFNASCFVDLVRCNYSRLAGEQ